MNTAKTIGENIKQARREARKSQLELADKLGFKSSVAISLIESGQRNISIEDLQKAADFLKRDIKFFLGEEERKFDIEIALRSDKAIDETDKEAILRVIELAKKKHVENK